MTLRQSITSDMINDFTVLIPVHNEADILFRNVGILTTFLDGFSDNYRILLVENGSKDGTTELLSKVAQNHCNVSYAVLTKANLGLALFRGTLLSNSEHIVYMPIDLSVSLGFVPASIRALETYDLALGSKRLEASSDERPIVRKLCSISYSYLIKMLFRTAISDTTCVKAFKRSRILPLLRRVRFIRILDTELIIKAERAGYNIVEIPVRVRDKRLPKENLLLKIVRKLSNIVALRILEGAAT